MDDYRNFVGKDEIYYGTIYFTYCFNNRRVEGAGAGAGAEIGTTALEFDH
jgi:hypothetical protein